MVILNVSLTVLVLLVGLAGIALNVLSLPGNWLMFLCAIGLAWQHGWTKLSLLVLLIIFVLLLAAEGIELLSSFMGARKFGASRGATWAALFGGFIGAIAGSFFLPIVGSILGAVAGSFGGALVCELINQKTVSKSMWVGLGAALGRTLGMVAKISCGLVAWMLLVFTTWF